VEYFFHGGKSFLAANKNILRHLILLFLSTFMTTGYRVLGILNRSYKKGSKRQITTTQKPEP